MASFFFTSIQYMLWLYLLQYMLLPYKECLSSHRNFQSLENYISIISFVWFFKINCHWRDREFYAHPFYAKGRIVKSDGILLPSLFLITDPIPFLLKYKTQLLNLIILRLLIQLVKIKHPNSISLTIYLYIPNYISLLSLPSHIASYIIKEH